VPTREPIDFEQEDGVWHDPFSRRLRAVSATVVRYRRKVISDRAFNRLAVVIMASCLAWFSYGLILKGYGWHWLGLLTGIWLLCRR